MRTNQQALNEPENQLLTESKSRKEFKTYVQDTESGGLSTKLMIKVAIVLILLNFSLLIFKKTKLQHQGSYGETNVLKQTGTFDNIGNLVNNNRQVLDQPKPMPRILWLQTDDELQVKGMQEGMVAQNLIHFAKLSNYQVRIVNNLNAYDWLSQKSIAQIKQTHQKSKVYISVSQLLRLALLEQHGGLFIRLPNILLLQKIEWIQKIFQFKEIDEKQKKALSCIKENENLSKGSRKTQILVMHQVKSDGIWYKDSFIAARPKSQLINILKNIVYRIVSEQIWPYPHYPIERVNQDTNVHYYPDITQTLINLFHTQDSNLCYNYGLQSFDMNNGPFMVNVPDEQAGSVIVYSQKDFKEIYGQRLMIQLRMGLLGDPIGDAILKGQFSEDGSILKNKMMMVDGNVWLTKPKKKIRDVHFCIVSLFPMLLENYQKDMNQQIKYLKEQAFSKWNIVNFVKNFSKKFEKIDQKTVIVNASIYEGLNLQRAATKYCDPASVILLLDYNQTLSSSNDLKDLANLFKPINTFAGLFSLKTVNKLYPAQIVLQKEVRRRINQVNNTMINQIKNHFRAFTVQSYRFIAYFQLYHSLTGRYFDRQIALLSMLQLSQHFEPCEKGAMVYQVRRLEKLMSIPKKRVFTNITINTNLYKQVDTSGFQYTAKFRHRHICGTIKFYLQFKGQVQDMVVFNDGRQFDEINAGRDKMVELIPRKIHQIWVKGEIPQFKRYLMKRLRDSHPDYQYFLWTHDNITRQNFPESFDLMQKIMQFDKFSPYNKMSVISDIVRHESSYIHGGFYLDTNYMLFGERPLDKYLTYSLVVAGQLAPRQRVFRDTAFFGATQHNPHIGRLMTHRALASRNYFSNQASKEAGPGLFGKALRGREELKQNVFQAGFEQFYPNFIYDSPNLNWNKCQAKQDTSAEDILFQGKYRYLKNCSDIYHFAIGMDFFGEGFSWAHRRW